MPGHFVGFHQKRIMLSVVQQTGRYEAGAYIRKADGCVVHPRQLFQGIDIDILKPFGG